VAGPNAEAFRLLAEAMARGDADALVAGTHPEAEAETLRSAVQGAFRGHAGAREFVRDNEENFEVFEPKFTEVEEQPDGRVLAIGSLHFRGRGSGVETEVPVAAVVEFREGLMYRYKDYGDAASARAALG
jgi:ketosteroid isomerase-like protein